MGIVTKKEGFWEWSSEMGGGICPKIKFYLTIPAHSANN